MKLSVIISNRNDVVMLNITLRSAIEALQPFLPENGEIVVVDNSDKVQWEALPGVIPYGYRSKKVVQLIRQEFPCFTEARMEAARQARGEYVFCVDSHVLFGANILTDCVKFMDEAPANIGFGHPPLCWAGQGEAGRRWTLGVSDRGTPWGNWSGLKEKPPCKMFWKFMPWICKRDWYLNTLNGYGSHAAHGLGWGGAEMLQQFKSLMLGYDNWAIDARPIIHIGPYGGLPNGVDQSCLGWTKDVSELDDADPRHYKYRVYGANGKYPGLGIFVAFYVFLGEEGIEEARKVEDRVQKRHGITVDSHWHLAREYGVQEHHWLKDHEKYTYHKVLEQHK